MPAQVRRERPAIKVDFAGGNSVQNAVGHLSAATTHASRACRKTRELLRPRGHHAPVKITRPRWESFVSANRLTASHLIHRAALVIAGLGLTLPWAGWSAGDQPGAGEASIKIRAGQTVGPISPYLTGACLEDVNHEVYGGLYSQMIFGESFQEPAPAVPPAGFRAFGGTWRVQDGELAADGGDGPKLVSDVPAFTTGEVGVEIRLADRRAGNAGLIVKVDRPGQGADNFDGYEVSLDAATGVLRLGRHRHNWELIRDTPCDVPVGVWIPLTVRLTGQTIEVSVNGQSVIAFDDGERALRAGTVGLRTWQRAAQYRNFWVRTGGVTKPLPFRQDASATFAVSGMWRAVQRGSAAGSAALETNRVFTGDQSQRLTFASGEGQVGIENQGLNRWGLHFVAGQPYEGYVWARADAPAELSVALESRDGAKTYATARLSVAGPDWQRLNFALTPNAADAAGRFTIALTRPGSVVVGHAFLQPGEWGRFRGLPVRKDVAEALIAQGITVLRYGGSMVNAPAYRWKKMIGPRDRRPPYRGTWYPHSSNGWGIPDFIEFCEAAGFLAIPAFNLDESPQDMADFVEYANGPATSVWGARRAADGHPEPYRLKHLELGNEERVDDNYWRKFQRLAAAIWAKDPEIVLVVGDFVYGAPIRDPFAFHGAASGITTLAAHQKILALARRAGREVWFDVHVGTEGPGKSGDLLALPSYVAAIRQLAAGARQRVVVFEFNAGNHQQRRALANAQAILAVERLGLPVATSANCLQPAGQNDNGWDQGLLFLNPTQVWLQPPGYVTRMFARNYQPVLVETEVVGADNLDANAARSEDGRTLVLRVVNQAEHPQTASLHFANFTPRLPVASVEELAGPLDAVNTAAEPARLVPRQTQWRHGIEAGSGRYTFAPHSFTIIRFN